MGKRKDIALGCAMIAIVSIFAFGMIFWTDMPKNVVVLNNLYYLTIASSLYMLSWIVFIVAQTKWFKIGSCIGIAVFSVNLFVEVFLDPTHWTAWSGWLIVFVAINMLLSIGIVERIKNNKNNNNG